MSFSAIPNYREPMSEKGATGRTWYQFMVDVWKGKPPASEGSVIPTSSPFTYTAQTKGFLIVQGGTVSLVQFSRNGTTNYSTGQTQGTFPLSQGDSLIVTYSVTPILTWVPQ